MHVRLCQALFSAPALLEPGYKARAHLALFPSGSIPVILWTDQRGVFPVGPIFPVILWADQRGVFSVGPVFHDLGWYTCCSLQDVAMHGICKPCYS